MLSTPRLALREYEESDLEPLVALVGDPSVMSHVGDGTPISRERAARIILGSEPGETWGAWRASDGAYVGHAWLVDGEIGLIVAPAFQRLGFGSEIARAIVRHALSELELPRVTATIDPDHAAAVRVVEKAGMRREREAFDARGRYLVYSISHEAPADDRR